MLHFQGSLCTVVAVHLLRSLESAELYVFITATSPNLTLDPLYQYMRPFELACTVNICSSFGDSTTAHYIDLPYAASLRVLGRNIASPAEPCSIVWVVVQMTAVFHRVDRRANDRSSTPAKMAAKIDFCRG